MGGREPTLDLLGQDHRVTVRMRAVVVAVLLGAPVLAGCSGDGASDEERRPSAGATASATATADPLPSATPAPRPAEDACYRLSWAEALAPTTAAEPVRCERRHTSRTVTVGTLDDVVDGHLVAVDSDRVQAQVARTCPERVRSFLGGSQEAHRLSMLRAVWFTPSVAESDAGARWFRCDVIAVAGPRRLATLTGRLQGALDRDEGREQYGMCATAAPDDPAFERVVCSARHSWRAIDVVDLPQGRYPGEAAVREAGQAPCEDAGRETAEDPLSFRWGYEWPTREQWAEGQTWGRCWAPD